MFPTDFKELLSDLNSQNSKYLIVGAYALAAHSQPRATKDMDILISPDPENARAVYNALAKFGAPLEGLKAADLIEPGFFYRMGTPPLMVDVLSNIKGIEFEDAWKHRIEIEVEPGMKIPFISAEDFIQAKLAAGREQDILDVKSVREAQRVRALDQMVGDVVDEKNHHRDHDRDDELKQ